MVMGTAQRISRKKCPSEHSIKIFLILIGFTTILIVPPQIEGNKLFKNILRVPRQLSSIQITSTIKCGLGSTCVVGARIRRQANIGDWLEGNAAVNRQRARSRGRFRQRERLQQIPLNLTPPQSQSSSSQVEPFKKFSEGLNQDILASIFQQQNFQSALKIFVPNLNLNQNPETIPSPNQSPSNRVFTNLPQNPVETSFDESRQSQTPSSIEEMFLTETQSKFAQLNGNYSAANNYIQSDLVQKYPILRDSIVVNPRGVHCQDVCDPQGVPYGLLGLCTPYYCHCDFDPGQHHQEETCPEDNVFDPLELQCKDPEETIFCSDDPTSLLALPNNVATPQIVIVPILYRHVYQLYPYIQTFSPGSNFEVSQTYGLPSVV